jgi:hypothetical protein
MVVGSIGGAPCSRKPQSVFHLLIRALRFRPGVTTHSSLRGRSVSAGACPFGRARPLDTADQRVVRPGSACRPARFSPDGGARRRSTSGRVRCATRTSCSRTPGATPASASFCRCLPACCIAGHVPGDRPYRRAGYVPKDPRQRASAGQGLRVVGAGRVRDRACDLAPGFRSAARLRARRCGKVGIFSDVRRSDSAVYSFCFKGAVRRAFVRIGVGTARCPNAFQAYDEGSIPFTRSNLRFHLLP